jgi:SH3-like domain-containing protein
LETIIKEESKTMSKNHNYSQYSNKKKTAEKVIDEVVEKTKTVEVKPMVADVEAPKVELPEIEEAPAETVEGVVVNCARLNVRAEPNTDAAVLCVLDAMSEIEIIVAQSTNEWFKICTATGIEGYCMRDYIEACM